jgi:hypothetical protein
MNYRSDAVWTNSDILFLQDQLRRGMSVEQLAGFLNRPLDEVRVKAREFQSRRKVPTRDADSF